MTMLAVAHPGRGILCCWPGMCWLTVEGHNASLLFCCTVFSSSFFASRVALVATQGVSFTLKKKKNTRKVIFLVIFYLFAFVLISFVFVKGEILSRIFPIQPSPRTPGSKFCLLCTSLHNNQPFAWKKTLLLFIQAATDYSTNRLVFSKHQQ